MIPIISSVISPLIEKKKKTGKKMRKPEICAEQEMQL